MNLVYSRRALADLDKISAYYAASVSPAIADSVGRRLEDVIERIAASLNLLRESRSDLKSVS